MKPTFPIPILTATALSALMLAACNEQPQSRIAAPEPPPLAELDTLAALPPAQPAPVRWAEPDVGYGYAERAYDLQRVFYDEPPDYGFDYDGYEPLVWETDDDWVMYAEPWEDSYRYYYFAPGYDYPYFIQDAYYGYGFDPAGVLIAVIAVSGAYLPADRYEVYAPLAGRYYVRGRDLYVASQRAPKIEVTETVWRERAPKVARSAEPWIRAAETERGWKAWREKGGGQREAAVERRFAPGAPIREARGGGKAERAFVGRAAEPRGRERHEARAFAGPGHGRELGGPGGGRGHEVRETRGPGGGGQQMREARGPGGPGGGRGHEMRQTRMERPHGPPARAAEAQGRPAAAFTGGGRGPGWGGGGGGGGEKAHGPPGGGGGGNPHAGGGQGGGGNPHNGGQGQGQGGGDQGKGHGGGKKG